MKFSIISIAVVVAGAMAAPAVSGNDALDARGTAPWCLIPCLALVEIPPAYAACVLACVASAEEGDLVEIKEFIKEHPIQA